jgi:hypothetical protein
MCRPLTIFNVFLIQNTRVVIKIYRARRRKSSNLSTPQFLFVFLRAYIHSQENPMQNLRNKLIAGGAMLILAAIGSVMNSRQSTLQGAGGPAVTIDPTQLPLPVQGSLSVSGTIAATQSGAWNVGINGTPNVNVANPATAPALYLNVNDPGRIPYQSFTDTPTCVLSAACTASFPAVPANHRLVIQHFSGSVNFSGTPSNVFARLLSDAAGPFAGVIATAAASSVGTTQTIYDQPVLLYFDPPLEPVAQVAGNNILSASFTLTGYMLDCTVAPCAAIAQ